MAKIVITRPKEWVNRMRKYQLVLDGNKTGKIKNDEIVELDVTAGRHTIEAKVDWAGSSIYELEITEGETKYLTVSTFKHANWLMPTGSILIITYILLLRNVLDTRNTAIDNVFHVFLVLYLLIIVYFLSIGRKKYLWLREG